MIFLLFGFIKRVMIYSDNGLLRIPNSMTLITLIFPFGSFFLEYAGFYWICSSLVCLGSCSWLLMAFLWLPVTSL